MFIFVITIFKADFMDTQTQPGIFELWSAYLYLIFRLIRLLTRSESKESEVLCVTAIAAIMGSTLADWCRLCANSPQEDGQLQRIKISGHPDLVQRISLFLPISVSPLIPSPIRWILMDHLFFPALQVVPGRVVFPMWCLPLQLLRVLHPDERGTGQAGVDLEHGMHLPEQVSSQSQKEVRKQKRSQSDSTD